MPKAHIGDTLHRVGESVDVLPGLTPTKAMVSFRLLWDKYVPD